MWKEYKNEYIELKPTDSQKSYYGKAFYKHKELYNGKNETYLSDWELYSYNSMVCEMYKAYIKINGRKELEYMEIYFPTGQNYNSRTTSKHKRSFLELTGIFELISWNEIKDYKRIKIFFKENGIEIKKEKY